VLIISLEMVDLFDTMEAVVGFAKSRSFDKDEKPIYYLC
jgi:hypothetical protein